MKSYLGLVPQYEKVHRKNNRISVLCIVLSVLLVTAIFSMADMALRAQKNYFIKTNGEYHISLRAFVEYRISKKSKNHWISHVKATVSDTSISSGSISGAEHLLIAIRG